jgi:hypothetical protein
MLGGTLSLIIGAVIALVLIGFAWKLFKGVIKLVVIGGIIVLAVLALSGHLGVSLGSL